MRTLGFVSPMDSRLPPSPNVHSGATPSCSFMFRAIEAEAALHGIKIVPVPIFSSENPIYMKILGRLLPLVTWISGGRWFDGYLGWMMNRLLSIRLRRAGHLDGLILYESAGNMGRLNYPAGLPLFLVADAPYTLVMDYYPARRNAPKAVKDAILKLEVSLFNRADLAFLPSEWAIAWTRRNFGVSSEKLRQLPWGANLIHPVSPEHAGRMISQKSPEKLSLLFIGHDWQRKGGDLAIETTEVLRRQGVNAELNIIGNDTDFKAVPDYVHLHGRVNLFSEDGFRHLADLMRASHFLLLPTKADISPIVIADANAFGVPAVTTDVGGLPSLVKSGVNGHCLRADSTAEDFASVILGSFKPFDRYWRLALSSRAEFDRGLSWKHTAFQLLSEITGYLDRHRRVGYVSPIDFRLPPAPNRSSGAMPACSFLFRALREQGAAHGVRIIPIPIFAHDNPLSMRLMGRAARWLNWLSRGGFHEPYLDWIMNRLFSGKLRQTGTVDALILFESAGNLGRINYPKDLPLFTVTDAPYSLVMEYYPALRNAKESARQTVRRHEKVIFNRAALNFFTSEWATNWARQNLGVSRDRLRPLPWGANLVHPFTTEQVAQAVSEKSSSPLKLLFLGHDWQRKGGPTAVDTVKILRSRGMETELYVVGAHPPGARELPDYVKVVGPLDHFTEEGSRRLTELMTTCHFLLLPTHADISSMVACEANAYGLPAITTDAGGIPFIIRAGVNGYCLKAGSPPEDFAGVIQQSFRNIEEYRKFALSARAEFERRLNWENIASALLDQLNRQLDMKSQKEWEAHG